MELNQRNLARWERQLQSVADDALKRALKRTAFKTRDAWARYVDQRLGQGGRPKALTRRALLFDVEHTPGVAYLWIRGANPIGTDTSTRGIPPSWYLSAQESGGQRATKAIGNKITAALRAAALGPTSRHGKLAGVLAQGAGQIKYTPPGSGAHFDANPRVLFTAAGNFRRNAAAKLRSGIAARGRRARITALVTKSGNVAIIRRKASRKAAPELLAIGVRQVDYRKRIDFKNMVLREYRNRLESEFKRALNRKIP